MLLRDSVRRDGLNPRSFFRLLGHAMESKAWKHLPDGAVTFLQFIERAGFTEDSLRAALKMRAEQEDIAPEEHQQFEQIRKAALRELVKAQPLPKPGEIGGGRGRVDNIKSAEGGSSESYTRRRLARDHPDLYERVATGELSPHRAAVEAGFRPRTATVRLDGAERAIALLLKHFSREELLAALERSS